MTIPFEVSIKSLAPPHLSETITGVPEAKASLMAKPQVSPGPTDGKTNTVYKNWSEKNLKEPLKLTLKLRADSSKKTNSISIVPYFGQSRITVF